MVDCGPIAPLTWFYDVHPMPVEMWPPSAWATFWEREGCPRAAHLWRTLDRQPMTDGDVVARLISVDWR